MPRIPRRRRWTLLRGAQLPSIGMLLCLGALLAIGLIFIHSAKTGGEVPFPGPHAKSHLAKIAMGMALLVLFLRIDYRRLEEAAMPLYCSGLVALLLLIAWKPFRDGPSRWIYLPGFSLQPSELVKLFTILLLARLLKPNHTGELPHPRAPFIAAAIPFLLIGLQPDLGTALVIPPTFLAMYWVAGAPAVTLRRMAMLLLLVAPLGWFLLEDYQKGRILVFLDPENPAYAARGGYQLRQALIAIGSGGLTGKGLYEGTQNRLEYIPEDHNDFIFAVIGEEWGLVGTSAVLLLFAALYVAGSGVAYRTREPFGRLVVTGVIAQLAFQTLVNLAMTLGMTPITGLPLPFISYGGTALIASIASLGIVLGIGMRPVRTVAPGTN